MTPTPQPIVHRILTGYFEEKAGYRALRPHGTHDWLLIYTTAGHGVFGGGNGPTGGQERITTSPGDAVLIRPTTLHDYRIAPAAKRWHLLWAHFHPRPDWQPWLDWPDVSAASAGLKRVSIANAADRRTVERALRRMNDHATGSHRLAKCLAINALEEALLWCARGVLQPADHDERVEQAQEYLCQRLQDHVTLNELADAVGLSASRLIGLFKRQTGVTPQRYYETQRLERARQLLELTGLPIKSIAAQVGYNNPFYFTLRFTRYAGQSPRAYRQGNGRLAAVPRRHPATP